jgi:hypothetical protein
MRSADEVEVVSQLRVALEDTGDGILLRKVEALALAALKDNSVNFHS